MDGVGEASLEESIVDNPFFDKPILDSPYEHPKRHWELDEAGQPTGKKIPRRRSAEFITPVPKPKKQKGRKEQIPLDPNDAKNLSTPEQKYHSDIIDGVREVVDRWRRLPNPDQWRVTPETARLLKHWRGHEFGQIRPFFCQVEAVETVIWLTEVAPRIGKAGRRFLDYLDDANQDANPGLMRLALKMATGSGKTTVMAMLIAWQTINAVRHPRSNRFTRAFLVVTPGITIRDRLRVLQPFDPDSYYQDRELVPGDMLADLGRAEIVITNYHAFKRRERQETPAKGGRSLLQGRRGEPLDTLETEGQMLQRAIGNLVNRKNILVINDEAHHCYRKKPGESQEGRLKGEDKKEAEKNREAARLWISGLETVAKRRGIRRIVDLSATPFFLRGSGYAEGTLFPWTLSDFSLMDAIECGIVKLPRVPIVDNDPGAETPKFRNLWAHIGSRMPKKGRGKAGALDPLSLPMELQGALDALHGHYAETFDLWAKADIPVPPCFIIVCNNTATSKLVHDYICGFHRKNGSFEHGKLKLFRNFDDEGNRHPRPRTLLIDSEQLESGEALDKDFRALAADEIEQF
uniref:Type III restriction enzyme, res subunit n=1 Tax=Candidatus Kentrum sp. LFY TaxID=2126342 RepID=A0A450UFG2_9GAMM|nr:MAG: Type III restriction enzyme, res subunit [Candidatus Kentron sp. LFY]